MRKLYKKISIDVKIASGALLFLGILSLLLGYWGEALAAFGVIVVFVLDDIKNSNDR